MNNNKNRGFTLLEMLLSVAIIALIAGIGAPIYQALQTRNNLDVAANSVVQTLRRAQVLSQAVSGDSVWGVRFQGGSITLFKGTTYAGRATDSDETFDLPTSITPSGLSEITYSKLLGEPSAIGSIVLTSNANETRNITINAKGMVSF